MSQSFIKLPRSYFESAFFVAAAAKGEMPKELAVLDLYRMARFKAGFEECNGQMVFLEIGELYASIRFLANRWSWSNSKVDKFLNDLAIEGSIDIRKTTAGNVITICHLATYENEDYEKATARRQRGDGEATVKRQQGDGEATNNRKKEGENRKNEKKEITTEVVATENEKIIDWFKQLKEDEIFIEQVKRQHKVNAEQYQELLKEFYRLKKSLEELTHRKYQDLRKNFLFWIPKHLNASSPQANGHSLTKEAKVFPKFWDEQRIKELGHLPHYPHNETFRKLNNSPTLTFYLQLLKANGYNEARPGVWKENGSKRIQRTGAITFKAAVTNI